MSNQPHNSNTGSNTQKMDVQGKYDQLIVMLRGAEWRGVEQAHLSGMGATAALVLAGHTPIGMGAAVVLGGFALGRAAGVALAWAGEKVVEHLASTEHLHESQVVLDEHEPRKPKF